MIARSLAVVLMLSVCLACGPTVLAQKRGPDMPPDPPRVKPEAKLKVQALSLLETDAREMAQVLHELYRDEIGKKLRVAVHQSTNILILMGEEEDLDTIRGLALRIETQAAEMKKKGVGKGSNPPK